MPENEIILDIFPSANSFIPEDLVIKIFLFNFSDESTNILSFNVPNPWKSLVNTFVSGRVST